MPYKEYDTGKLKRYWSIGQVAKELGISASTIRHWESECPFLKPKGTHKHTAWRKYNRKERDKIQKFHTLRYAKGYTIQGAMWIFLKQYQ